MYIKFNKEKVTPFGFAKNGEPILIAVEKVENNAVQLGIFNYEKYQTELNPMRANCPEIPNSINFESIDNNSVAGLNAVIGYLKEKGFVEITDFEVIQSFEPQPEGRPIRLLISAKEIIENFSDMITTLKSYGVPYIIHSDYYEIDLQEIFPADFEKLINNNNVYIKNL